MSEAHRPPHINPITKQWLQNKEQFCWGCYEVFRDTRSGDMHRRWKNGTRVCVDPYEVGLVTFINKYGTNIWERSERQKCQK